jgi:hypothetical protein
MTSNETPIAQDSNDIHFITSVIAIACGVPRLNGSLTS